MGEPTPDVVERAREWLQLYDYGSGASEETEVELVRDLLALVQQLTTARDAYRQALVRLTKRPVNKWVFDAATEALRGADAAVGKKG